MTDREPGQDREQEPARPVLRVVRGDPTPEELAALLAVVAARSAAPARPDRVRSPWVDRGRHLRRPLSPGPGAWRASALPGPR
jgi:hypothetical protein